MSGRSPSRHRAGSRSHPRSWAACWRRGRRCCAWWPGSRRGARLRRSVGSWADRRSTWSSGHGTGDRLSGPSCAGFRPRCGSGRASLGRYHLPAMHGSVLFFSMSLRARARIMRKIQRTRGSAAVDKRAVQAEPGAVGAWVAVVRITRALDLEKRGRCQQSIRRCGLERAARHALFADDMCGSNWPGQRRRDDDGASQRQQTQRPWTVLGARAEAAVASRDRLKQVGPWLGGGGRRFRGGGSAEQQQ